MAWPTSQPFRDSLTASHEVVSRVDVLNAGAVVYAGLPFTAGHVVVDESARNRRTLSLTVLPVNLDGVDLEPRDLSDLLSPATAELAVFSGLQVIGSGVPELVPVGVFGRPDVSRSSRYDALSVSAGDRCQAVTDARFVSPVTIAAGADVVTTIRSLLLQVDASWEVYDLTNRTAHASAGVYERDRWQAIDALARSIGAEVTPDPAGRWLIRPTPTVPTEAEALTAVDNGTGWLFAGGDGGALVDLASGVTLAGVYNAVVANGEPGDGQPPVTGWARIESGPLAWRDGFKKPRFYASPVLSTAAQCVSAARSLLPKAAAFARTLEPTALPNPAADVGDPCLIVEDVPRPTGAAPVQHRTPAVVRRLTVPLTPGPMDVQVRVAGTVTDGEGDLT